MEERLKKVMDGMTNSILISIKKLLDLIDDDCFDSDIIIYINSAFATLTQIGIGPREGFSIYDSSSTWDNYLPCGLTLDLVKTYIFLKVKQVFDPPSSSSVMQAYDQMIKEHEWRLEILGDHSTIEKR